MLFGPSKADIGISAGVSIPEAKERIHFLDLCEQKKLDILVCKERREELRAMTRKSTFVEKCMDEMKNLKSSK